MSSEDFLGRIHPLARNALEQRARRRRFDSGQVLFWENDEGRDVFVIVQGLVKVLATATSGREVILEIVESGALLGELSAIDGKPRSATAVALTATDVLIVSIENFIAFLETHSGAATELVRMVAARLRQASRRELEFGTSDTLARICRCLLDLLDRHDPASDDRTVALPITQQDLASMSGLSREAVVKGLRALRLLGWIESRGREITLVDVVAVRARADA